MLKVKTAIRCIEWRWPMNVLLFVWKSKRVVDNGNIPCHRAIQEQYHCFRTLLRSLWEVENGSPPASSNCKYRPRFYDSDLKTTSMLDQWSKFDLPSPWDQHWINSKTLSRIASGRVCTFEHCASIGSRCFLTLANSRNASIMSRCATSAWMAPPQFFTTDSKH
jgi:hypothetical protein